MGDQIGQDLFPGTLSQAKWKNRDMHNWPAEHVV